MKAIHKWNGTNPICRNANMPAPTTSPAWTEVTCKNCLHMRKDQWHSQTVHDYLKAINGKVTTKKRIIAGTGLNENQVNRAISTLRHRGHIGRYYGRYYGLPIEGKLPRRKTTIKDKHPHPTYTEDDS